MLPNKKPRRRQTGGAIALNAVINALGGRIRPLA